MMNTYMYTPIIQSINKLKVKVVINALKGGRGLTLQVRVKG
jgi:hypothetical protein